MYRNSGIWVDRNNIQHTSKRKKNMRTRLGMAKVDKFVIHSWFKPVRAIGSIVDFSGANAVVKICKHLFIPSTFVSGQRTR